MNLKCPQCGGPVVYDPTTGKMKCSFCGSFLSTDEFRTTGGDTPSSQETASYDEYMEMQIYHCSSCGADLMVDKTQATAFCSYCGSPSIIFDRVSKEVQPKKIIPFKITADQALRCIKDRFGHGSYIPPTIKALTVDKVRAIYIPFWLYSAYAREQMLITTSQDGNTYTYDRDASCNFTNVTMDASLRLSNDMAHRLEPYYMNELEDFDIAYLSGYFADKYDVPSDALAHEVKKKCLDFLHADIMRTCPRANSAQAGTQVISNYQVTGQHEEFEIQHTQYAFLPAYFVNLRYKNTKCLVIVNGQTGKVVGNLPFERSDFMRKFAKNALISCSIFSLLSILFVSFPPLIPVFILPIIVDAILLYQGIKGYQKYKFGLMQLASKQMASYTSRSEV